MATLCSSIQLVRRAQLLTATLCAVGLAACTDTSEHRLAVRAPHNRRNASVFQPGPCPDGQLPPKPDGSPYGIGANQWGNRFDNNPPDPTTNATYSRIARSYGQANVGWVRVDFDWGRAIAPSSDPAQYNWRGVDATVQNAVCQGVNILGNLAYTPSWASVRPNADSGLGFTFMPADIRQWGAFVRQAVDRYPQIRYWSIWNEPNARNFFRGTGDLRPEALVAEYNRLITEAAPHIISNVDAQGRRYLVAPELGSAPPSELATWLGGVIRANGDKIDGLAVHHYGGSATEARTYMQQLLTNAGVGWSKQVWLTEVGLTGCNDKRLPDGSADRNQRLGLGYCTGDSLQFTRDGSQSAHLQGVMAAMPAVTASGAVNWAKTFYWHSHTETLFDPAKRGYQGVDYGLLRGAAANQLQSRPAFTDYAQIAGPLGIAGPGYVREDWATVSVSPAVPASAHYIWEWRWCYNGSMPGDCDGAWYFWNSGQDVRDMTTYVGRAYYYIDVRVRPAVWAGGPELAAAQWRLNGAGECVYSSGCIDGPYTAPAAAPTDGDHADAVTGVAVDPTPARPRPRVRPPGVRDEIWARMLGRSAAGAP